MFIGFYKSYAEFLRENIFLPLGMTGTVFDDGLAVHENKDTCR